MRGDDLQQAGMFSYLSPEQRVPAEHPLRAIRKIADAVFVQLSPQFDQMYARMGRPSIAPEKLLRALLLQVLYSVRSERLLIEEIFGWLKSVGLLRKLRHRGTEARELDLHLRDGRLQPGKNEKAGDGVGSSVPRSAKRSLPEAKTNQKRIA